MQEISVNNWEEFEDKIKAIENDRLQQKSRSKFLYRGQSDHNWSLSTTIERNWQGNGLSLKKYHHLIFVVRPQIESYTGVNWSTLSYPDQFEKWLNENNTLMPHALGSSTDFHDTYSYMVYLRHYGFPSPFLDWSSSPYVAAYFAFRQATRCKNDVSIYVYLESSSSIGLKSRGNDIPCIYIFGPYVKTDRRHFIQQSQYTVCIVQDNDEWMYVSHEAAFARCDTDQDLLWKFNIPYSERLQVLKMLDRYNINALSLFGSEESLMETMALREIHLRDREL
ncbi:MAG: FRG domain-containing protein [Candidatus Scalinduaceae bacterium]